MNKNNESLIQNGKYAMEVHSPQGAIRLEIHVDGHGFTTKVKKDGYDKTKKAEDIQDPFAMLDVCLMHFNMLVNKLREAEAETIAATGSTEVN